MRTTHLLIALALVPAASLLAQDRPALHDPLAELARTADEGQSAVIQAIAARDPGRLVEATLALERRSPTDQAGAADRYVFAAGVLEILSIQRAWERTTPDAMPAAIAALDRDDLARRGIEAAAAHGRDHPDDSDADRVRGELISLTIRGMASGLSEGPKAKEAVESALRKDPANAWAVFALGRMHYHNPSFAGGDLDAALDEFRRAAEAIEGPRPALYLGLAYQAKGMLPQARFWAAKALRLAPEDPEARQLLADVEAELEDDR